MITEQEKIEFIVREGAKKGISLSKFIDLQIKEFKDSEQYKEMLKGDNYYKNINDIKNKKRVYIDKNGRECVARHLPNYRIQHPILYKLTNQKTGYLLKRKMTIKQVLDKNEKNDDDYEKILKKIFNNSRHKTLKYTLIEAIKKGIAWWQIYIDKEGELKAKLRYATKIIPMWADDEHETLDSIIMTYPIISYESGTLKKKIIKVEYWDLEGVRYLVYDGNNLIEDIEETEKHKELFIKKDKEGKSVFAHFILGNTLQLWKKIPFVYFKYNSDELPLIHYLKSMLDCYDSLTSRTADSIDELPNGVHVVKNYSSGENEKFQTNLQTYGTVFLDEDGEYDRKNITIDIEAFKVFIEQLRKDIYEGGQGVDTQSEKFGNQESGEAMKQLYADLDLDCSNIETEFQSSLEYFMFFVNNWIQMNSNHDYSEKEIEFIFNKTMTVNEKELIENCKNSIGIISNKSILSKHPYVNNVEDELDNIENEKKQEIDNYDLLINKKRTKYSNKDGDE